jgi:hypothetical protein
VGPIASSSNNMAYGSGDRTGSHTLQYVNSKDWKACKSHNESSGDMSPRGSVLLRRYATGRKVECSGSDEVNEFFQCI